MSTRPSLEACIFDLDGVLVDTAKYHFLAWRHLANELGFDFDEEANEKLKGVGRMESLEIILSWGGIDLTEEQKQSWAERKNGWYLELVEGMDPSEILEGVMDFLEDLKKNGIRIGIASSSKNAATILEKIGLSGHFETLVDGNGLARTKPDPLIFLTCAQALGVDPGHAVVFEDAQSGIDAALAGGFWAVGVGKPEVLSDARLVIPGFKGWTWAKMESALLNPS